MVSLGEDIKAVVMEVGLSYNIERETETISG